MTPSPRLLLAAGLLTAGLALTADAAHASVTVEQRTLVVTGSAASDKLTLRARPRAVVIGGRKVARRRFDRIVVRARGGDDLVRMRGRIRRVRIEGGSGADKLAFTGSRGDDAFRLSPDGARVRLGGLVASRLEQADVNGLAGADTLTTDDLTGTTLQGVTADLGGADGATDRVVVSGTQFDDTIDVADTTVTGLAAPLTIRAADELRVNALAGFDRVSSTATALAVTADGGAEDDALVGGPAAETFLAGDGNDAVDGNGGDDTALLGAGDDRFTWDAGDGSDVVEGQDGMDTTAFNGSGAAEVFTASADGPRVRFTRDVGNVAMDLDDVERIDAAAAGGGDRLQASDVSGTDLTALRFALGTDGSADQVAVDGSSGADAITATGAAGNANLTGLPNGLMVALVGAQVPGDTLIVNGLAGDDTLDAAALALDAVRLTVDAGAGADTVRSGRGPDLIIGGDGNDGIDGNQGDDTAFLGAGDDRFTWDPGDGSDVLEGQSGQDTMAFNGAARAENFEVTADGGRVRFLRDVANIDMDLDDVERIDTAALGGTDRFTAGDVTGTDLTALEVALGNDGAADDVIALGSSGTDVALVTGGAGSATLTGLSARLSVTGAQVPADRLSVRLLAGDDRLDASGLAAAGIAFRGEGGNGDDVLIGGAGADVLRGDAGDDVLVGGPANDDLDGGAGDNTVIQD